MLPVQAWRLGQQNIGTWNPSSQLPALRTWIFSAMAEVDRPTCLDSQVETMCLSRPVVNDENLAVQKRV
jgi:hypothetical protein